MTELNNIKKKTALTTYTNIQHTWNTIIIHFSRINFIFYYLYLQIKSNSLQKLMVFYGLSRKRDIHIFVWSLIFLLRCIKSMNFDRRALWARAFLLLWVGDDVKLIYLFFVCRPWGCKSAGWCICKWQTFTRCRSTTNCRIGTQRCPTLWYF